MTRGSVIKKFIAPEIANAYLLQAFAVATLSKCARRKTGAVIVEIVDGVPTVIASGCNGGPSGGTNVCETCGPNSPTRTDVIHAEINALRTLSNFRRGDRIMFCTDSPCPDCMAQILRHPIDLVMYAREYREIQHLKPFIAKRKVIGIPFAMAEHTELLTATFDQVVNDGGHQWSQYVR